MQSKKKCKRPRRERVDARDFAKAFVASVGSADKALANVKNLASVSLAKAGDPSLSSEDAKYYKRLSGFWENVAGVIRKTNNLLKSSSESKGA